MQTIKDACKKNDAAIQAYINNYTFETDTCSYTPDEKEHTLITDAIYGLLADDEFVEIFIEWRRLVKDKNDMTFVQSN